MYEDKTLKCKDCGNEFVFTAGEQAFYAERGFQNEPSAARHAVMPARTAPVAPVSSSPLPAHAAVVRRRFPSSPSPTVPCSAASASLRCAPTAKSHPKPLHPTRMGRFSRSAETSAAENAKFCEKGLNFRPDYDTISSYRYGRCCALLVPIPRKGSI